MTAIAFFVGLGVGSLLFGLVGGRAFYWATKLAAQWEKIADEQSEATGQWRHLYELSTSNCDGYELLYRDAKAHLDRVIGES